MALSEITFTVTEDLDAGGYCARWNDPTGGGIATQGDDLAELQFMIKDAVEGYFEAKDALPPQGVRLHFVSDPIVALAAS